MSAIPAIIAVATIVVGLLVIVSRRSQPGLGWGAAAMPLTAAVILGLAAYVVAGSPQQMGSPVAAPEHAGFGEELEDPRQGMAERFGPAAQWLGMSDGLLRTGRTESAAQLLQQGLRRYPRSVDLWVGYGNALVAHAGGAMTPAAAS
nr:tetratricopeptide repeat protein [Sphingopyxis sp.]